jgi:hypothetical protein
LFAGQLIESITESSCSLVDLVLQGSGGRLKFALSLLGCGPDLVFEADEFGNGKMQKLNGIGACSDNVATLCRSAQNHHP